MSQDRRTSGRGDSGLIERAEALLDEAVGKAAKGSYGEAAEKAQQALAIDPDNTVARDLLDSYRHQVTDDDERRRRRRSIAAAAAAIEEMVESERLDEASSATDALVMQFGLDAPVEDLRQRIAEARASHLEVDDVDAAFDKIRVGDGRPSPAPRNEPGGAVAAEIEEHLRAGRLDQASRALDRLEAEPAAIERAAKLRTRIEEAHHVAAEHRREEEILIATAAIEDRIRRGDIDEAAVQLADLSRRHGGSAPVAELHQRLVEARALGRQTIAVEAQADGETAEPFTTSAGGMPVFQSMVEPESSGRGRLIAIVIAVVIALAAGAWWLMQRGDEAAAPPVTGTSATEGAAPIEGAPESGALDASPPVDAGSAESIGALDSAPVEPAAPAVPSTASDSAAVAQPAGTNAAQPAGSAPAAADRAATTAAEPRANVTAAESAPPEAPPTSPNANVAAVPAADESRSAVPETSVAQVEEPPTTEVVVEPLPAAESPPPAPAPPPPEPSAPPRAAEAAPAPVDSAATPATSSDSGARPEPAGNPQQAAVAEPPTRAAAPPPAAASAASGPALLGCGDPGVVCVKALQVPQPRYPAAARNRRLSGTVVVMALVDATGRVVQTRVDSGSFAFFNDAAVDAAKRATFQPATRQGVAGQSWARLTFKFDQQ